MSALPSCCEAAVLATHARPSLAAMSIRATVLDTMKRVADTARYYRAHGATTTSDFYRARCERFYRESLGALCALSGLLRHPAMSTQA